MASKILLSVNQVRNIVTRFRNMRSKAYPTTAQICKCMFDEFRGAENPCIMSTIQIPLRDRTHGRVDVFSIMYQGERRFARVVYTSESPAACATEEEAATAFAQLLPNVLHDCAKAAEQNGREMFPAACSLVIIDEDMQCLA
jgi:hypothetical protein